MLPKTNKEPTPGEKRYAQEALLGGEPPLWMQWVTKRKRDKVQDRLLVIGKYRIFSIKRTVTGKKQIQRVGHFFDLKEIYSADVDKAVFKFKEFEIDVQAPGAGTDLIHQLRLNWQKYTYSFPDYALPKISLLPQERQLQPLPSIDPGPCHGLIATYEAYCSYYGIRPSQEFVKFAGDLGAKGSQDFPLDELPGIERREKETLINFLPISSALRHNTYFSGFTCKNIPRREVADMLADTMLHNTTIKKLSLVGIFAREEAFVALGAAMKRNAVNSLVDIDFSKNPMKERGAIGIADGLQFLNHSIYRLNVSNCGLNPKGAGSILQSFCFGKEAAKSLTELDISHNSVGQAGIVQLSNWFNQTTVNCQLKYLILCNTNIKTDAALIFRTMKNATVRSLEEIDISFNKLDAVSAQSLAVLIDTLPRLQVVNLSYCGLTAQAVDSVLRSLISNPNINDVNINISGNEIGVQGAVAVAQALLSASNLGGLFAKNCGFKKEGLTKIIDAFGQNMERTRLKALDLGFNFATGTASKVLKLMNALGDALKKHPTLEYLGLAGNGEKLSLGKEIEPLFKAVGGTKLVEIDLTGNKFGDSLAVTLCDNLRTNPNLRALYWDNNGVSIGGWRALQNLVSINRNIVLCPTPVIDFEKSVKDNKSNATFKDKAKEILDAIRDNLKANSGGQTYTPIYKVRQGKTYGDNYRQPLFSATAEPGAYPPVENLINTGTNYSTMRGSPNNDYNYQAPPPDPYGGTQYGAIQSYGVPPVPGATDYYEDSSVPPPPPGPGSTRYEDTPTPPPRSQSDYADYDYEAPPPPSYDYPTEFDDSQYDDSIPPPPAQPY